MQQSYLQIIEACELALADYSKTQELLEYPEVMADKGYYLSLLKKFNELEKLNLQLKQLKQSLNEEQQLVGNLSGMSDEERILAYEELATLRKKAMSIADTLAEQLNCGDVADKVFCKILCNGATAICQQFVELIKQDLTAHKVVVTELKLDWKKSELDQVTFTATGSRALSRLGALSGTHKVANTSAEISLAATPAESVVTLDEKDVKIDLFHSSGAGGQNINKVETAVRATHIPTGTVVVCQDERSQLNNKRRALLNLAKKLSDQNSELEQKRMKIDIQTQLKRVSVLSFNSNGEYIDKVNGLQCVPDAQQFSNYINAILASNNY